jgi:hypothetical protein
VHPAGTATPCRDVIGRPRRERDQGPYVGPLAALATLSSIEESVPSTASATASAATPGLDRRGSDPTGVDEAVVGARRSRRRELQLTGGPVQAGVPVG